MRLGHVRSCSLSCQQKSRFAPALSDVKIFDPSFESDLPEALDRSLSSFPEVKSLKEEQRLVQGRDVFAQLPSGFGKSLIFQILPPLCKCLKSMGHNFPSNSLVVIVWESQTEPRLIDWLSWIVLTVIIIIDNLACWIINLLWAVLLCSIAEKFYSLFVFWGENRLGYLSLDIICSS